METTVFLARVIGLFGAISTLAILIRYKTYLAMEESAAKNPVLTYLSGFFILLVGLVLTLSHPVWTLDWPIVITIIGWLVLIKGALRILFPEIVQKLIDKKQTDRRFLLSEIVVLLISLYLIYQGFELSWLS